MNVLFICKLFIIKKIGSYYFKTQTLLKYNFLDPHRNYKDGII